MSSEQPPTATFTGVRRRRKTSFGVRLADRVATGLITLGGIGTIVAVLLVCFFLLWVAGPLFLPARTSEASEVAAPAGLSSAPLGALALTDDQDVVLAYRTDATIEIVRLADGATLLQLAPPGETGEVTAFSYNERTQTVALGHADGTVRLGRLAIVSTLLDVADAPAEYRELPEGRPVAAMEGIVAWASPDKLRLRKFAYELDEPLKSASDTPVALLDHADLPAGPAYAVLHADGTLSVATVKQRKNLMTGKVTTTARQAPMPFEAAPHDLPVRLMLTGLADNVLLLWDDGRCERFDAREGVMAEKVGLMGGGAQLTAAQFLIGRSTLVVGDSAGGLAAWFRVKPADATTPDGAQLVDAHQLAADGPAITALAASARTRTLAVGTATGGLRLYNVTSQALLWQGDLAAGEAGGAPVDAIAIAPKDDGLLALAGGRLWHAPLDLRYPEASLGALFRPVWYEGYNEPRHVWQSSSGTDDFEPKLGLWPLVFGTIKATVYSMLFAVPLALMAAIFTSEFLRRSVRSRIKPVVELMASLPSVVLGFLGGLVLAPFVEHHLATVLASIFAVPLTLLAAAHLWQMLPTRLGVRWNVWRLPAFLLLLPIGMLLGRLAGGPAERLLFGGDLKLWLDGQAGSPAAGWFFMLLPLAGVGVWLFIAIFVNPIYLARARSWNRLTCGLASCAKFAAGIALAALAAWALAAALVALGADPRGGFLDTYVQRNALIVGFVMGFAVIPIIYTIAEDALSAVPEHLRAASLGAGATPWQTAVRIVVPTAMSGLFSAVMVGLGRAVGETMIVLMAAGNTPVLDWNVFNGFRTLSANIAVELPEAVRNSTHYRTLFFAALVLFVMTFFINTAAEVVRLRFRKRTGEL